MANKLDLEIDSSQAKSELAALKAEMAQLIQQAQTLKSALSDATGNQRGMIQGALSGIAGRMAAINTSLGTAQSSSVIGRAANNPTGAAGVVASGSFSFGAGGIGGMGVGPVGVSGVMPMNPGTTQGQFGSSGYTPTLRFAPGAQPGISAPVQPTVMMGLPPFYNNAPTMQMAGGGPTLAFTAQQAAAAAYGMPPAGGGVGFSRYGVMMAGAIGYAGAQFAEGAINYQTDRIRQGGVDYMAQGRNVGQGIGSVLGGAVGGVIGSAFGPLGTLAGIGIGTGIGGGLGGAIGNFFMAGRQNVADSNVSLAGFFGSRYGMTGVSEMQKFTTGQERVNPFAFGPPTITEPSRLQRITDTINKRFAGSPELTTALPTVAQTFGTVAGTLFNYGVDPFGPGEPTPFRYRPFVAAAQREHDIAVGIGTGNIPSKFPLMDTLIHGAKADILGIIPARGRTEENIAETYTRRLGLLFGKDSADAAKRIGPGFDPYLGGNVADVLGRLGATDTLAYLRIHNKDLSAGVDEILLSQVAGGSRANARAGALGALQPLGSGRAQAMAFAAEGANIAQLPGGTDSLAFAQAYAGFRGARGQAFEQDTLSGFGLRDLALHGEQQRQQYMPFAPGNIFATSLGIIANNRRQIGALQGMLRNTDLSESERYGYESQRQGLMTENARNVGMLSEGFENRLPALAAGRPGFFGRYNSEMGAAINLGRIGSPIRAYGATGASRGAQEAFVRGLGGDTVPGAMSPTSRTLDLNTTNSILDRILQALLANGGHAAQVGHARPADNYGGIQGPAAKDIGGQQKLAWASH